MELERRQRQRRRSKDRNGAEDASRIHDVPDDVLWQILLRLDSPIWLVRAACACKRWRRVVTATDDGGADEGRAFLRLASSLHPPTVVGQYQNQSSCEIRFVPAPSSAAGASSWPMPIAGSRRFSVDFLDKNSRWYVADCHGGLVLLRANLGPCPRSVPDLVVYDPLTGQHRPISRPAPPRNEQASDHGIKDTCLLDGDDGGISISNFRVLYRLTTYAPTDLQACVFSTANGGEWDWRRCLMGSADEDEDDGLVRYCYGYVAGRAGGGSLYLGSALSRTALRSPSCQHVQSQTGGAGGSSPST